MTTLITDVICDLEHWLDLGLPGLSEHAAIAVLDHFGAPPEGFQIAILGCNDQKIAQLNCDFRGKPRPTNVLSWPSEDYLQPGLPEAGTPDDPTELGDIAISFETCEREAAEQAKVFADHVIHLLVHAMLHLLGYDHEEDNEAELMEGTEKAILASIGIADPYV